MTCAALLASMATGVHAAEPIAAAGAAADTASASASASTAATSPDTATAAPVEARPVPSSPTLPSSAPSAAPRAPSTAGRPLWEVGVAVLGLHAPDYPGANTHRWRGAAAPIVVYRGKRMRLDDDGVRGRLASHGGFEFDISGAAAFNARQSEARRDMPELDYTFELGPQALYRFRFDGGHKLSAHLKARAVVSTNWQRMHGRGMVFEPELRWQRSGWPDAASSWVAAGQAVWATEALHDYFYEVDPAYATATRPAFNAHGGYFGSNLRAAYSRRLSNTTMLSMGTSLNSYRHAANASSPLLQRRSTAGVFMALIWTPWRSSEMTE